MPCVALGGDQAHQVMEAEANTGQDCKAIKIAWAFTCQQSALFHGSRPWHSSYRYDICPRVPLLTCSDWTMSLFLFTIVGHSCSMAPKLGPVSARPGFESGHDIKKRNSLNHAWWGQGSCITRCGAGRRYQYARFLDLFQLGYSPNLYFNIHPGP